jgi:hypothetical protein
MKTFCYGRTKVKFLGIASMEKKKCGEESIFHPFILLILPSSSRKAVNRSTTQIPQSKQGFLNYVFCKNWAVRNPAGTRLDSV